MIMSSPPDTHLITGADLLEQGDCGSCELIEGRMVPMNPPGAEHGRIELLLGWHLLNFVNIQQHAWVLGGETGLYIQRNPDTVRGMDIAVISKQRLPTKPGTGYLEVAPELVVEIVSPSDRWLEIENKIRDYFRAGVDQVWVVQPQQQILYVYRSPGKRHLVEREETLQGEGILKGFSLAVATLF